MVTKQINEVAYRLELPNSMKIHLVFHVSLLELYKEPTIPSRLQAPPLPIEIDGEEEFEVSEILDSGINWKKLEYLVYWQVTKSVKGLGNLLPTLLMLLRCFRSSIANTCTSQASRMFESNTSRPTPASNLVLALMQMAGTVLALTYCRPRCPTTIPNNSQYRIWYLFSPSAAFKHSSNGILPIISSCLLYHFFYMTFLVLNLLPCNLYMDFM